MSEVGDTGRVAKSKDARIGNISNVKDPDNCPDPTKHFESKHMRVTSVVSELDIEKTTNVS